MLDKPITLRSLMHVALFVCLFPFSMPFYFPRTSLVCAGVVGIGTSYILWGIR